MSDAPMNPVYPSGDVLPGRRLRYPKGVAVPGQRMSRRTRNAYGNWRNPAGPAKLTFEHCGVRVTLEIPRPEVGETFSIGRVSCPLCGAVCWSGDPADFPW